MSNVRSELIFSFCIMKKLRVFLFSPHPGWDATPSQGSPPPQEKRFTGTHLYTCVEWGTVIVKSHAQEHNTMTLASRPLYPHISLTEELYKCCSGYHLMIVSTLRNFQRVFIQPMKILEFLVYRSSYILTQLFIVEFVVATQREWGSWQSSNWNKEHQWQ